MSVKPATMRVVLICAALLLGGDLVHSIATSENGDDACMRFFLFTLFHLAESATERLLFRLQGEPERVETRLYSHFTLARDAAGGDPRLDARFDWLYEASRRVVAQRTAQLELLPESGR